MARIEEDKLNQMLKGSADENLWILYGDDNFLKEFYCNKIVASAVDESLKMFNYHVFNDDEASIDVIFEAAENLPVMSEKTCILVRNFPLSELKKDDYAVFTSHIADLPDTTVMIFYYSTIDVSYNPKKSAKWAEIIDLIAKYGTAAQLNHRTPEKLAKMFSAKAKERNAVIDTQTALYFVSVVGGDMNMLVNEFNKLCTYSQGQPVTNEMIDEICVKSIEASVFNISEAIMAGDADRAFEITTELLRQKTPAQSLIGALSSAYVNMYRCKNALNADKKISDFASDFGYGGSTYQLTKILPSARKTKMSAIRRSLDILSEADIKSKSTSTDPSVLLTELIAKLCAVTEE